MQCDLTYVVCNGFQVQFSLISTALSRFVGFILFVFCLVSPVSTTLGLLSIIHFLFIILSVLVCIDCCWFLLL